MGQTNNKSVNYSELSQQYPQKFSQSFLQVLSEHSVSSPSSQRLKRKSSSSSISLQCLETTHSDDESLSSFEDLIQETDMLFGSRSSPEIKINNETKTTKFSKDSSKANSLEEGWSPTNLPMSERINLIKSMVKLIA